MAGIACKRKGHSVSILEESITADRDSYAAGIRLGDEAQRFLINHDILTAEDSVDCSGLQFVNQKNRPERFVQSPMRMTSWEILYYHLRGCFDGHASRLCPNPPIARKGDGKVTYTNSIRVTNVEIGKDGRPRVESEDLTKNGRKTVVEADRVIMADGSNSRLRQIFAVAATNAPQYAGYVAWRGTVKESAVSSSTREAIGTSFLVHKSPPNYILVSVKIGLYRSARAMLICSSYTIPGSTGSTKIGERLFNFGWYHQIPENSGEFGSIMTDARGHRHRATIPPGDMDPEVWERQKTYGRKVLAPPFAELIENTEQPFISTVREAHASQASYHEGRIITIGDALATFRPHIAMSVNQAALNCIHLERMLDGEITVQQWTAEVERYSRTTARLSTLAGDFVMYGISMRLLSSAVAYLWELASSSFLYG